MRVGWGVTVGGGRGEGGRALGDFCATRKEGWGGRTGVGAR